MSKYLEMAINNIAKKGDTDIFPFPIENAMFYDKPMEVKDNLVEMDKKFDEYLQNGGIDCIKACIPVGQTGFRLATLIDPAWNALYLARVLEIAGQIEQKRIPVDNNTIFSYRLKYDQESGSLFDLDVTWKDYYTNARRIAKDFDYVITFDISDFYYRVYHERLKNILIDDIGADNIPVNRIMSILSGLSAGNDPYSLPVGGNASRILAEALLTKTDDFMKNKGISFCRFVDDYIVFANSKGSAYSILNDCADFFLRYLGLSLQKNKTSILKSKEFIRRSKALFDEGGGKNDARNSLLKLDMNLDPYSVIADDNLRQLQTQLRGIDIISLLKSECRKSKINHLFGKKLVRTFAVIDDDVISEAFEIVSQNFEKLYPIFPVIMRATYKNLNRANKKTINLFVDKLLEQFDEETYIIQTDNNASYAIRALSSVENEPRIGQSFEKLFEKYTNKHSYSSDLVKVNLVYAMINSGNSRWFINKSHSNLSNWERRALVAASSFLGDDGKGWKMKHEKHFTPLDKMVETWVSEKKSIKKDWKLPI